MRRPYFQHRIGDLKRIFVEEGEDREVLLTLAAELEHRRTPKAKALHERVAQALAAGSKAPLFDDLGSRETSGEPAGRGGPLFEEGVDQGVDQEEASQDARAAVTDSTKEPNVEDEPAEEKATSAHEPRKDREPPRSHEIEGRDLGESETLEFRSSFHGERRDAAIDSPATDALLATWITLEVLEPQALPTQRELASLRRQLIRSDEHVEPWSDLTLGRRGNENSVYWFVYLGELSLGEAMTSLLNRFPDASPEKVRRARGSAPLAAIVLDENGCPATGKTFLSSFAWGYGKVRAGELRSLADFPGVERGLCQAIEKRLIRQDEDGEIEPVSRDDLDRTIRWLVRTLGLAAEQVKPHPVFVRVPIWWRAFEAPEPELLNSFFVEDLARVREAARDGDVGEAFSSFVRGRPQGERVDSVRELALLDEALAPDQIPLARWPLRGRFPLSTMQQAAVNHVSSELSVDGLVGINGPPGTGKTTLLRDVIAKVVLDRARAMERFEDPQDAFSHVGPMRAGRGYLHLYELHESLVGHEIVVASSNNKAVENVSREIPSLDAVADDMEPSLRYFETVANAVRERSGAGEGSDAGAWGLAAAVLGNASNKHKFAQAFWWDGQRGMRNYLKGIADGWDSKVAADDEGPPEILFAEDAPRDRAEALERWRDARQSFREILARAEGWRETLEGFRRDLHRRSATEAELTGVVLEVAALRQRTSEATDSAADARARLERARARTSELSAEREALQSVRPGFFSFLFQTRRYRDWRDRLASKLLDLESARNVEDHAEAASIEADHELANLSAALGELERRRLDLERTCIEIRQNLARARALLGERLPDRRFWSLADAERQTLSPWLAEASQAERDLLFAASFDLHRAFIDASAQRLGHNLGVAMELLKGRTLSEKQEPARRSIWASLFLTVPVISTTFASVNRMFGPLGREQLGWLLIDEAGQAVPQAAVGAIWRSRRVVAVGDPMQLEPVVTLPGRLIDAIAAEYAINSEVWTAPRSSVQSLADQASWFGTWLSAGVENIWVGSPLRVHRRCQEPMFRISNGVAYDGLMVQCTPEGPSEIGDVLGPSAWISVASEAAGHWSPEEGEVAVRLMLKLLERCEKVPDVFFITPFRHVMLELRRKLQRVLSRRLGRDSRRWVEENVGTIHVFQGKEAEAVVLVLGAPSEEAAGARRWAGSRPNLLNVAVSRAKRRLYVVGHRERWRDAGLFRVLHRNLPQG